MATGPMQGVKVLDLSIAATGPLACALLADQGASVVKVERPGIGDIGRWVGVSVNGMSALYAACNRGKRCIAVDVHTDDGRALVLQLAREADVFVQNFRPGVMDRLGLGYDAVRAESPDVVYVSLSGFGPAGPYADKSAYDTVIQAYGGFATTQADPAIGDPVFLRQTAADKVTALTAVQAITAALFARERGRGGQHVQLAMLDAIVSFLWADAAGNEVLMDSPGTAPSSFVSVVPALPFPRRLGYRHAHQRRRLRGHHAGVRHRGRRRPACRDHRRAGAARRRLAPDDGARLRGRGLPHHERRDDTARSPARAVRRGALTGGARRRPARTRGGDVRGAGSPDRRSPPPSRVTRTSSSARRRSSAARHRASGSTPTRSSTSSASATESTSCVRTASWPDGQPAGPTFVDAAPATARDQASSAAGPALTEARKSWTNAVSTNSQNCEIRSPLNSKRNRYELRYVAPFGVTASSPTKAAT